MKSSTEASIRQVRDVKLVLDTRGDTTDYLIGHIWIPVIARGILLKQAMLASCQLRLPNTTMECPTLIHPRKS